MTHLKQGDKPEVMLKAVMEKGLKNGWEPFSQEWIDWVFENDAYKELLFDLEFAKAYWGEDKCIDVSYFPINKKTTHDVISIWEYHLQQAVLSENPLLYYFQHL